MGLEAYVLTSNIGVILGGVGTKGEELEQVDKEGEVRNLVSLNKTCLEI